MKGLTLRCEVVDSPVEVVSTVRSPLSAQDFWKMRARFPHHELVDGDLIPASLTKRTHGRVEARIAFLLEAYLESVGRGEVVTGEVGYVLGPDTVRAADVAVHLDPPEEPESGFETSMPDLIVEVVSPNDRWPDVEHKVFRYLQAGVREVWVVDPKHETVAVRLADTVRVHEGEDRLSSDVLPGFECAVSDIFRRRKPPSD